MSKIRFVLIAIAIFSAQSVLANDETNSKPCAIIAKGCIKAGS